MERGIYFDAWLPGEQCFHPSKAPRRRGMIDDLKAMRGTTLVWSALGGGSVSLPFLEQEAWEPVPARFRQHGYVNDSEFAALCKENDIDIFAVVFEAQGWELPAKVVGGEVRALNMVERDDYNQFIGLREFTSNSGPADWKLFESYFPDGLTNSAGEAVTDLFEEAACRDLDGHALHATWVEVPGNPHLAHYMDRNNPVWREYLKAVIRVQVDAGVSGIQFDESETPIGALRYGGCFCKDCVVEMRNHLLSLSPDERPVELAGMDLTTFDYREWLLAQGCEAGVAPQTLPLYRHYIRALTFSVNRTFREVTRYAREYAESQGRSIRIIGNFFDCIPYYDPMVDEVDLFISEVRLTRYRQPWWYRHAVGFARDKQVIAVENPYGGVIPELNTNLRLGKAYDQFRVTIFEASAMGANMALPYGSWLGSEIRDSYWAPTDLVGECGEFLEEIDALTSTRSTNTTAVLYSVASAMSATVDWDLFNDGDAFFTLDDAGPTPAIHYWDTIEALSGSGRSFDVVVAPDEQLRANDVTAESLGRYRELLVISAWAISPAQHEALVGFVKAGGRIRLFGDYGTGLSAGRAAELLNHDGCTTAESIRALVDGTEVLIDADLGESIVGNTHDLGTAGIAIHLVNYAYNHARDAVTPVTGLAISIVPGCPVTSARLHRPGHAPTELTLEVAGDRVSTIIPLLETYAVIHLS